MNGRDLRPTFWPVLFYLLAGPLLWAGHFFAVYAPQSALCAFRLSGTLAVQPQAVSALVAGITVVFAVPIAVLLWRPALAARLLRISGLREGNETFLPKVMRLLAMLSLAGVIWAGAAAILLDPCGQLR